MPTEDINPHDIEQDLAEDDDTATGSATAQPSDSNEVLKLQAERNDLFNKLARAQAEFQNARRRIEADKEQAVQFANSGLIKSLLPVIDNFERAIGVDPAKTDVTSLLKG